MTILVTGGAGFIGTNFVLEWLRECDEPIVNLDKLTYAGNLGNLQSIAGDTRHTFVHGDIVDQGLVAGLLQEHRPRAIVHIAAETHVDRSIHGPAPFIQTNIVGTFQLLVAALGYWRSLDDPGRQQFRFVNVSTDEVFGSLDAAAAPCDELAAFAPNSPYAASKAAADHLVRSYYRTYDLPVITTHCTNNYGPYQFPEKLIPLMTINAARRDPLPVYGDGKYIRDWLYVADHCAALRRVMDDGRPGETYNIAGNCELTNLDVIETICNRLDAKLGGADGPKRRELIEFVPDRPGHDRRYALATGKIAAELGWQPQRSFECGMDETLDWYLGHTEWIDAVTSGQYRQWMDLNYTARTGTP